MTNFNNTEDDYISRRIEELVQKPRLAKVQKVTEHTETGENDDLSNIECTVTTRNNEQQLRNVPVMNASTNTVHVPEVGDTVVLIEFAGRGERNIIIGTVHTTNKRSPVAKEGDIRYKRGDLVLELDGNGEYVRMYEESTPDSTKDESKAFVEIRDESFGTIVEVNSKTQVSIKSDSQVSVESDKVFVNSGYVQLRDPSVRSKSVASVSDSVDLTSGKIIEGSNSVDST